MDEVSLESMLASGLSVEKIARRFGKDPSTVSYWMAKYGLKAPNREKHAAKGGIPRERLEGLVAAGMSIAEIAGEVELSKGTVRHWLRKHGIHTLNARGGPGRSAGRAAAKETGHLTVALVCPKHGETEFSIEGRGNYRCGRCRSEAVTNRRRRVKAILVQEAGGRCAICGYDRYNGALSFHHLDPTQKRLHVSAEGKGYAIDVLRTEAAKCILLCANCHAEVESGLSAVPVELASGSSSVRLDPG
jgi:transposase-like protein